MRRRWRVSTQNCRLAGGFSRSPSRVTPIVGWAGVLLESLSILRLTRGSGDAARPRLTRGFAADYWFGRWSDDRGFGIVRLDRTSVKNFTAVIERDSDTGLYVGWVPGFPGAHSQGETLDELRANLQEVVEMLLEDGDPRLESEFVGTQTVEVA